MNKKVLMFTEDSSILSQLEEASSDSPFNFISNPDVNDVNKEHFIICDPVSYKKNKLDSKQVNKDNLYMVSGYPDEENMKLLEAEGLRHLVGKNDSVFAREIICHISRTKDKKIWGLQNLLSDDSEIKILSLSDSKYTDEMIQEVLLHFDFKDYFTSPSEYIRVMANELVSNSLYKGPNRKRSEQGLQPPDRKSTVYLKGSDLVQVTVGMDAQGIALSVQDSFGGLHFDTLIASLKRSFKEKTVMENKGGAGLGLYLTFLHSNQFIVNYRENYRTEVICVIDKNKRYKHYKQRIRSFHFFQEVLGEKTDN